MSKIALIVESIFPPVGRSNIRLYNLAKMLAQKGHEVHLIALAHGTKFDSRIELFERINVHNVVTRSLKISEWPNRLLHVYSGFRYIIKNFSDINYIVGWNFYPNLVAYLVSRKIKAKFICDMTDFGWDFFCDIHPSIFYRPIVHGIEYIECKHLPRTASHVCVVSNFMKKTLIERYGIKAEKITVVPDGIDIEDFKPKRSEREIRAELGLVDKKIILYHGDVDYYDGFDVLVDAFKTILNERKDVRLLVVGEGRKYFKKLKEKILGSELGKFIIFTGWVGREKVVDYVSIADVGVIPARKRISTDAIYTLRLFEYLSQDVPVVASRLETISTILEDGVMGYLVPPENPSQLGDAIKKVLDGRLESNKQHTWRVVDKFRWENVLKPYLEIIH